MQVSIGDIARGLSALRRDFSAAATAARLAWIEQIPAAGGAGPAELMALHEELLFASAYAANGATLPACGRGLREVARRVKSERLDEGLQNSGVAHSRLRAAFSSDLLRWLDARFGGAVRLAWEEHSRAAGADELWSLLAAPAERDGLQRDDIDTRAWLRAARGPQRELQWVTARLAAVCPEIAVQDVVLDRAGLSIEWTRLPFHVSRSGLRFPPRAPFYHSALSRDADASRVLHQPLPRPAPLSRAARRRLIEIARLALATRERETDPVTYADERETTLYRLERGIDVALFGMRPEHRLPIESYFGFVAAKNRVPIAYGGGWVFLERCEIGVNLFETFRGGESALIFSQVMRVYHQHYGARRFTVAPYQFGAGNDEAIRSGAFWFYHRLGFRSQDAALNDLAQRETERILADKSYRTSAATLRRFARAPLELWADPPARPRPHRPPAIDLARVSFAVTRRIGRAHRGDAAAALRAALRRATVLNGGRAARVDPARLTHGQQALLLLFGALPGIERWSAGERADLIRIMRAKGGPLERTYAQRLQRHARLREALLALCRSV